MFFMVQVVLFHCWFFTGVRFGSVTILFCMYKNVLSKTSLKERLECVMYVDDWVILESAKREGEVTGISV